MTFALINSQKNGSVDFNQLVERTLMGEEQGAAGLVRSVQSSALRYARSILGNDELARDAVQEAFIESFAKLHQLRIPAAYPSWFRRIVFKQCDRILRKQKNETGIEAEPIGNEDPFQETLRSEVEERFEKEIKRLPEKDRRLAEMHFRERARHRHIAEELGWSEHTVKNRLRVIRRRLQTVMLPYLGISGSIARNTKAA